ncbi:diguanylate cyclase [Weissella minor]|uniref:diguanylate cyclase n=1 Tax=Weissella minor TaxID=1620 RepID=UPI001BAF64D9|nr:diguanylate cyclase [Weissella minor]
MAFLIAHVSVFFFISLMLIALLYVYQSTLIYSDHALPKLLTIFLYIGFTYIIMAMDANLINRLVLYFVPLLFITLNTALWKVIFCASIHPWLLVLYIGRYYHVTPDQARVLLISELLLLLVLTSLKALIKNRHALGVALALFFALLEYWQSYQFMDIITPKTLVSFSFVFVGYVFFSWLICYIDDLYQKRRDLLLYDIHNDTLTGAYNYHQLTEDLFRKPPINNKNAWIIVFDIDYFKHINDTYGHQEGNIALKLFADTLKLHIATL